MKVKQLLSAGFTVAAVAASMLIATDRAAAATTYAETTGGAANTWGNYASAGLPAGPQVPAFATIQIACKVTGFRVSDGNTWWYRIASAPWNYAFYVSADAFYNNGASSGSLLGTPFVDSAVPDCAPPSGGVETAGGVAATWTDYASAGGIAGPQIAAQATVQISCKVTGFRVADGNTWWYRIASAPWNDGFYVSADAFYNGAPTGGTLVGTPFVDPAVPDCVGGSGSTATPTVTLTQGPAAPQGYRYAITLNGFPANSAVSLNCYDSVSPGGFYPFSLTTNASGSASTANYCYSGDGPDHWVIANGRIESNHVSWNVSPPSGGGTGGGQPTGDGQGSGAGGTATTGKYNRTAAISWAISNAEAPQPFSAACTWFVSNALWAGGLPKSSTWTNEGSYGLLPMNHRPGTPTANAVPLLSNYLLSAGYATKTSLDLSKSVVPQAQLGDVIVYSWDGGKSWDHMAFITHIAPGSYPDVSEWGSNNNLVTPLGGHPSSPYIWRGWTWSELTHQSLQTKTHGQVRAYLLHIKY